MRICSCPWVLLVVLAMSQSASHAAASDELVRAVECRERSGLPNVLSKLKAGAEVRIAYLGGSITAQEWLAAEDPQLVPPALPQSPGERNKRSHWWNRLGPWRVSAPA